jgi:hypothetical protein
MVPHQIANRPGGSEVHTAFRRVEAYGDSMASAAHTPATTSHEDNAHWRWAALRLAHEVERTLEIKRARGSEIDPLDKRLEELSRAMVGSVR